MEQISPSLENASHKTRVVASFGTWEILTPTVSQRFQGSHRAGAEVGVRPVDSDDVDILGNEEGQSGGRKTMEERCGERDIEGGRSRKDSFWLTNKLDIDVVLESSCILWNWANCLLSQVYSGIGRLYP